MALTIGALPVTAMAEGAGDLYTNEPLAVVENRKEGRLGDYGYSVLDGETLEITYYYGTDTDITIPSEINGMTVTSLGDSLFARNKTLTSVIIPDSVTSIGEDIFNGCTSLTSVSLSSNITSIGEMAFYGCVSLKDITLPVCITTIERNTFTACTSLTSIVIPDGVKSIASNAFWNCTSLSSVTIPGSVTYIGTQAFFECTSLKSIVIPDGVYTIGDYAFGNCTGLTSITIGDGVSFINDGAFSGCSSLKNVTFGSNITSIGKYAFDSCIALTSVTIPDKVTSIGYGSFLDCANLVSAKIGDSVTNIDNAAFGGCGSLKAVSIPVTVTTINKAVFNKCDSLTDVYYYGTEAEWNKVTINGNNDALANATIHFNCKDTLEKTTSFVERLYTTMLARSSDPTGKANHISSLMKGKTAAEIGAKFVLSTELKNKKLTNREFVKRMYQTFLDRTPSSAEITRWAKTLDNGCTYEYILGRFVASAEFKKLATNYGITAGTYTPTQNRDQNENVTAFVSRMYTKALKRNYDVTGLNNHTGRILQKTHTPAQIAKLFFFSAELKNKNLSDEEFVTRLYNALFDRNPDATGKANWLNKMKNGYTREKVFDGFAASAEFKNLVASFGL